MYCVFSVVYCVLTRIFLSCVVAFDAVLLIKLVITWNVVFFILNLFFSNFLFVGVMHSHTHTHTHTHTHIHTYTHTNKQTNTQTKQNALVGSSSTTGRQDRSLCGRWNRTTSRSQVCVFDCSSFIFFSSLLFYFFFFFIMITNMCFDCASSYLHWVGRYDASFSLSL